MSIPADQPVIIEVALNGATQPSRNPHVPQSPDEVADDGLACLAAGASIVHSHTTLADYAAPPERAAELYAEAYRRILAEAPDALCYPTIGSGTDMETRTGHIDLLAEEGLIRIGLLDPGSLNLGWADEQGRPSPDGFVYVNSYRDMDVCLEVCRRHGLGPSMAIYEGGFLQNALSYWRAGLLPPGGMVKLYFGGEFGYMGDHPGVTFGFPPTPAALDAYLDLLEREECELPWSVTVMGGDVLSTPVARLALERGGHLHVGLEDHRGGTPTNVELVERAVALCAEVGRPVASCADAAEILGLP